MKSMSVMALACVMAGTMVPSFAEEAHDIDTGRQLFVDDVLVETMDGLVRRYHYPVKYSGNPVLKAETKFEIPEPPLNRVTLPKGGGLWWDAKANVFKLWYEVGWCGVIHYATS